MGSVHDICNLVKLGIIYITNLVLDSSKFHKRKNAFCYDIMFFSDIVTTQIAA